MVDLLNIFFRTCTALTNLRIGGRDQRKLLSSGLATPICQLWIRTDLDCPIYSIGEDGAEALRADSLAAALRNRNVGVNLSTLLLPRVFRNRNFNADAIDSEQVCHGRGIAWVESSEEGGIGTWERFVELGTSSWFAFASRATLADEFFRMGVIALEMQEASVVVGEEEFTGIHTNQVRLSSIVRCRHTYRSLPLAFPASAPPSRLLG